MELVALQQDVVAFNAVMSACENVGELHGRIRHPSGAVDVLGVFASTLFEVFDAV